MSKDILRDKRLLFVNIKRKEPFRIENTKKLFLRVQCKISTALY